MRYSSALGLALLIVSLIAGAEAQTRVSPIQRPGASTPVNPIPRFVVHYDCMLFNGSASGVAVGDLDIVASPLVDDPSTPELELLGETQVPIGPVSQLRVAIVAAYAPQAPRELKVKVIVAGQFRTQANAEEHIASFTPGSASLTLRVGEGVTLNDSSLAGGSLDCGISLRTR